AGCSGDRRCRGVGGLDRAARGADQRHEDRHHGAARAQASRASVLPGARGSTHGCPPPSAKSGPRNWVGQSVKTLALRAQGVLIGVVSPSTTLLMHASPYSPIAAATC